MVESCARRAAARRPTVPADWFYAAAMHGRSALAWVVVIASMFVGCSSSSRESSTVQTVAPTAPTDNPFMIGRPLVIPHAGGDALFPENTFTEPGWPQLAAFPLKECLTIVLTEEWEHHGFAARDLHILAAR